MRFVKRLIRQHFFNFLQCNKGFISLTVTEDATYPTKKATCECGYTFCSKCGRKWSNIHSKENCKPKQNGMDDNEDWQMNTNATCPQCKYKYYLERGGCMHITCSQVIGVMIIRKLRKRKFSYNFSAAMNTANFVSKRLREKGNHAIFRTVRKVNHYMAIIPGIVCITCRK